MSGDLFDSSFGEGGLVVSTGGYSGGLDLPDPSFLTGNADGSRLVPQKWFWGFIIIAVILIIFLAAGWGVANSFSQFPGYGHPGAIQFSTTSDQVGVGGGRISSFSQENRDRDYARAARDGFSNAREAPYFPDVTNRVLRMENREKEAVRALGKINQERLRRSSEDTASTNPLAWGPFWKEWKSTHVMDGEDVASGFESEFERQMNHTGVY